MTPARSDSDPRLLQMRGTPPQFSLAKSYPGFGPTGPVVRRLLRGRETFLVSPDELSRLAIGQAAVSVRFGEHRLAGEGSDGSCLLARRCSRCAAS